MYDEIWIAFNTFNYSQTPVSTITRNEKTTDH